jgi:tetratricopeptide (TPR) repeat protein
LLDAEHQMLFNCLGVFAGSFALTQCEEICGPDVTVDILDGLATLVDHSLIKMVSSTDEPRFTMLETIRELAQEHLSAAPLENELRTRHANVYAGLVQEGARHFTRSGSRWWLDRIEVDHDNMRAALKWAIARGDADLAFSVCFAMWRFWQMRGWLHEGRRLVEKALTLENGSIAGRRDALEAAGGLAYWQADSQATLDFYAGALDLAWQVDDAARLADALYNYSVPLTFYDSRESARIHAEEALTIGGELGDRERLGTYTWGIGSVHYFSGEYDDALVRYMEAARHLADTGAVFQIGWTEYMIGTVLIRLGRTADSEPHLRRGLMIFAEAGDISAFALHVRDFAELAILRGDHQMALRLAGAAAALQDVSETRMLDFVVNQLGSLEDSITIVGEEEAEKLIVDGRAMSVPEILEMVGYRPAD